MKYKYNVGDKVRVLDGSDIPDYTCGWCGMMSDYVGRVKTIGKRTQDHGRPCYRFSDCNSITDYLTWDERGLELVETKKSKPRIVVYIDKKDPRIVVAKDTENGNIGKARCAPEDTFDFYTGAQLAMMRLFDTKSFPEEPRKRRLRVGDYVVGNEKNNYAYTSKGTVWRVVSAATEGSIIIECPSCSTIFPVEAKYFDLYTGPLFNGDVACIESDGPLFTKGKIYHVEDGGIKGVNYHYGYVSSVAALNAYYEGRYKFLELVI